MEVSSCDDVEQMYEQTRDKFELLEFERYELMFKLQELESEKQEKKQTANQSYKIDTKQVSGSQSNVKVSSICYVNNISAPRLIYLSLLLLFYCCI